MSDAARKINDSWPAGRPSLILLSRLDSPAPGLLLLSTCIALRGMQVGIPMPSRVGLYLSGCQLDQLFGLGKASNRGLSRLEDVDSLIWDVKCLHKGRCGKIEVYFLYPRIT